MKFVLKLIFNRWFYVGVGVVIVLIYVFPGLSLGSIQLPSFPTMFSAKASDRVYIPRRQISNTIIGITYANMTIAYNNDLGIKNASYNSDIDAMVAIRAKLLELIQRDFAQLMDNAKNRKITLDGFISQLEVYVDDSKNTQVVAVNKMQDREASYQNCASQKAAADTAYLNAIAQDDAKYIESLLDEAKKASSCMSDYRIQINAYALPLKQLQEITQIAESYVITLNENYSNIVDYYELLRGDILQNLLLTKQKLGL